MKYDYIIIGAGLGGLCSAIILAKENKKVLVIEQHYKPGGYLHSFKRKNYQFETGFHFSPELQSNQILTMYWKYLGIYDKLHLVPYDPNNFHTLIFPDFKIQLKSGFDNLKELLYSYFPDEKKAIDAFINKMLEIKRHFIYFNSDHIGNMEEEHKSFEIPIVEYLDSLNMSEKLKAVILAHSYLYGVPPKETPLGTHAIFFNALYSSSTDIQGGGDALINALVESLKENGGELILKTMVKKIKTKDSKITGVVTEDERFFECENIIFSANPKLSFDMFEENVFRPSFRNRIEEMENSSSHFGLYLATDYDLSYHKYDILYFPDYNIDSIYSNPASSLPKDAFIYYTVPTSRLGKTKDGHHIIETLSMDDYKNYQKWANTKFGSRPDDYKEFKNKIMENTLNILYKILPEIKGKIIYKEASTPLTNKHFTNSPEGSIYGIKHNLNQMHAPIRARTKLEGFYYTGQSLIFPGIVGVTITSFVTCSEILGQDYLFKKIDKEVFNK